MSLSRLGGATSPRTLQDDFTKKPYIGIWYVWLLYNIISSYLILYILHYIILCYIYIIYISQILYSLYIYIYRFHSIYIYIPCGSSPSFLGSVTGQWFKALSTFSDRVWIQRHIYIYVHTYDTQCNTYDLATIVTIHILAPESYI